MKLISTLILVGISAFPIVSAERGIQRLAPADTPYPHHIPNGLPATPPPARQRYLFQCKGKKYDPYQHVCYDGEFLCPIVNGKPHYKCGDSCFDGALYSCGKDLKIRPFSKNSPPPVKSGGCPHKNNKNNDSVNSKDVNKSNNGKVIGTVTVTVGCDGKPCASATATPIPKQEISPPPQGRVRPKRVSRPTTKIDIIEKSEPKSENTNIQGQGRFTNVRTSMSDSSSSSDASIDEERLDFEHEGVNVEDGDVDEDEDATDSEDENED